LIVYRLDLFEREPASCCSLAALLWGGVIAVSSGRLRQRRLAFGPGQGRSGRLHVGLGRGGSRSGHEEILKLTGVVCLFLIVPAEFDGVMDGFVYGAMVGLGFTVVEDVSYFIQATAAFGRRRIRPGPYSTRSSSGSSPAVSTATFSSPA
jgi:hypothetical protein